LCLQLVESSCQVQEACSTTGLSELLDAIRDKVKDEAGADVESETQAAEVAEEICIHDSQDMEANSHLVLTSLSIDRLTEDAAMKLSRFQQHAIRVVATYTKFEVEPDTEQQVMLMIQKCFPSQQLTAYMCGACLYLHALKLCGLLCGCTHGGALIIDPCGLRFDLPRGPSNPVASELCL
jgi:hypothetical protein